MRDTIKQVKKGPLFLSGLLVGGALGAAAVFLAATPTGRNVWRNVEQGRMTIGARGFDLFGLVKEKTIDLRRSVSSEGKKGIEEEQMIPIPKDYV
ncbi:YtxH domain-containing protein [Sporolactobacillus sp. THM7-7]|nr:YtxH domain-containing protein [Sporolactobacillus sp. THM7-7]